MRNLPHNTHLLHLHLDEKRIRFYLQRKPWARALLPVLLRFFKFNNKRNSIFKISFAYDPLNDHFQIRKSYRRKENMLQGNMLSLEQAINLYHLLCQTLLLEIPGDVVELGCYEGTTAILLQNTLDDFQSPKALHVYDSFRGLPTAQKVDGNSFKAGELATTQQRLIANFEQHGVKAPKIHAGWFTDTLPTQLPEQICFAHVDGDFYDSIAASLVHLYPRLSRGAVTVVDDYCDPAVLDRNNILPGVKQACDEFLAAKMEKMTVLVAGTEAHGYFRKM